MARKVLIVDDNAINRMMLKNTLGSDYDVLEAENGREALAVMYSRYKLLSAVLLDIMMPEMDGYELLQNVRENPQLAQIPIIMVTGSEEESARVKALSLGANDFIIKPYNPEIVRHCLRNNIALRETASILNAIQRDKLTGLYNREAFFERVKGMIAEHASEYYILSCFDIDNFKLINDQYGAPEGDRILREIGKAVGKNTEEIGGIAARISADNFAAIFPAEHRDTTVLRRILDKALVSVDSKSVSLSVGRYLINDLSLPASAIYDRAYIAKQSVKGRYDEHMAYFDEAMLEKLIRDQQITGEMEQALKKGQFEAWFQPQYDHSTGTLIGAEALARWRHPQRGIIPPGEFIPLFEQNGFVYELDKYIWRDVCSKMRSWLDKGCAALPVSVNVSRYDIFRSDLVEVLTGLIREFDLPIDLLRLEVTESAFAVSTERMVELVKELIALGFTVEIDDFGSGYSSLNTLKNVPAQIVKLDMRFLEGDNDAQRGGNILESVVRMTKWLGMTVLAEGVEQQEQADYLKSIGCTYVQGFLYSRPIPAEEYAALLYDRDGRLFPETGGDSGRSGDSFWDPGSVDTLVFNRYSAGACVYEYCGGHVELIRITDRYIRNVFGADMSPSTALKIDWEKYVDEETAAALAAAMEQSILSGAEVSGEYLFTGLPGCPRKTWLHSSMRVIASAGERHLVYCISENVTARHAMIESLRMREEEYRLAVQLSGKTVCRYDVTNGLLKFTTAPQAMFELTDTVENVPASQLSAGLISPDTAECYADFYQRILRGEKSGEAQYQRKAGSGWRWIEARFISVYGDGGEPASAVIAFQDVSDSIEKEVVYKSWQQSIQGKAVESYSLYHCSLSADLVYGSIRGMLLPTALLDSSDSFANCTRLYCERSVAEEDRRIYADFADAARLLAEFAAGRKQCVLEYRETTPQGGTRWLRLTVYLIEAMHSKAVEAYMLFENIDRAKQDELSILERAESDPLTGVLNRMAFAEKVDALINTAPEGTLGALLMLDIDGFKQVNDVLGHGVGDKALVDMAGLLRKNLRRCDLVGRLGGDEFVVFLSSINTPDDAARKAAQICQLSRRVHTLDVQTSVSVGVVLWPQDGGSFEALYKRADETLYYVKDSGKDNYAFYHGEMADDHRAAEPLNPERASLQMSKRKRRILLVDDNRTDLALLENIFAAEYTVDKAFDGSSALVKLRHFGSAYSVVLLDLTMPGMDGLAVLEKMQSSVEMRSVPAIVVTGDDSRDTNLSVIRAGAADYITKPVDPELLRIRVSAVISKAENERQRAQNSFLELQSNEMASYKTVLERTGTLLVEHDWITGRFTYSRAMSEHLSGSYDDRPLWLVLLSDMVTDPQTVRRMQQLDHDIADDRSRRDGSLKVTLKSADGVKRPYLMNIYKQVNEYGLTDKLILTFKECE